jgi:hypothetical protein
VPQKCSVTKRNSNQSDGTTICRLRHEIRRSKGVPAKRTRAAVSLLLVTPPHYHTQLISTLFWEYSSKRERQRHTTLWSIRDNFHSPPGTRNLFGEEGSSVEISPSVRYRPFSDIIYMLPIPHTLFVFCVCTLSVRPAARFVELNTARQKCEIPHSWCQIDVPIGPFVCRLDRRLACQPVPLTLVDESAFPGIQPDRQYVTVSYILCELGMLNMYPKEYLALLRILYK